MCATRRRERCNARPLVKLRPSLVFAFVVSAAAIGCSGNDGLDVADHHDEGEEIGTVESPLVASDPVSAAVAQSCSTTAVKGLATQLVEEIICLKPGSMKKISGTPGLALGAAVFPYLQTPAANALVAAQKARGVTMSINSGLRTLPQQYLLYRWYQTGRCGIGLAASPGTSNHESGIAVDINDNAGWRSAMAGKSYRWLGAGDPVHFDFIGGGTFDMRGLSVKAFQRLWNRNNPNDKIAEDGDYGPATAARLAKSPVGGFAKGAQCNNPPPAPPPPPGSEPPAEEPPIVPDATETGEEAPPAAETQSATIESSTERPPSAQAGCALSAEGSAPRGGAALAGLAFVGLLGIRRRRRTDRAPISS